MSSMDMEQRDYDSRTALHVAAAEGNHSLINRTQGGIHHCWLAQALRGGKRVRTCFQCDAECVCLCVSGHAEVVRFLLEACKVNPVPRDR